MNRRHYIKDPRAETAVGVALLVAAGCLLHDAYERRARKQPIWLKPFSWW